jgi:hypothetical protein
MGITGTRFQVELHSSLKNFFNYEINNSIGTYNLFFTFRKIWIGLVFIYIKFPFMTLRNQLAQMLFQICPRENPKVQKYVLTSAPQRRIVIETKDSVKLQYQQ